MKRGFSRKSLELLKQAVAMDDSLKPALQWKHFRDIEDELNARAATQSKVTTAMKNGFVCTQGIYDRLDDVMYNFDASLFR